MNDFMYLADKIRNAKLERHPFEHLYIENFFSEEDFAEITKSPEVDLSPVGNDEELIQALYARSFKEIIFPGTTTNIEAYLKWHAEKTPFGRLCEGYGVTMRLQKTTPDTILADAHAFFKCDTFWQAAADRFGVSLEHVRTDFGLQKYLDGYEISPHPDIRAKALTFMINVNPAPNAEDLNFHTHYLVFKPERDYIKKFWATDKSSERSWVPWDWCETIKVQSKNNSIVIFSPSDNTMHGVKADYDHLVTQRTQFYGNLWFKTPPKLNACDFTALDRMKARVLA